MSSLPEDLREWAEFDEAQWALAKALGLMPDLPWNPGDPRMPGCGMRATLQSSNLLSGSLDRVLDELVAAGAVERAEGCRYRWRRDFDWLAASDLDDRDDRWIPEAGSAIESKRT